MNEYEATQKILDNPMMQRDTWWKFGTQSGTGDCIYLSIDRVCGGTPIENAILRRLVEHLNPIPLSRSEEDIATALMHWNDDPSTTYDDLVEALTSVRDSFVFAVV